jgi:hypothetical protein
MKKVFLTFVLIHSISFLFSQTHTKPINTAEGGKRDKALLLKNDPVIDINNWAKLNTIAQKAYNADQASRMPIFKINQVNYLYSSSYEIINSSGCKLDINEINFQEALSKRSETEVVSIPMKTKDGCNYTIELFTLDQVQKQFKKIETENK